MVSDPQKNLEEFKKENDYPGRFIGVGLSSDAQFLIIIYAITARSASSRNRILVFENETVRTAQADPKLDVGVQNITLYPAIMKGSNKTFVVSNGVQTQPIVDALKKGKTFEEENDNWDFEPDSSSTERISALVSADEITFGRISQKVPGENESLREFYHVNIPQKGTIKVIHTYAKNGEPPPSSYEAPYELPIDEDLSEIAKTYSAVLPFFLSIAVMKVDKKTMNIQKVEIINSKESIQA